MPAASSSRIATQYKMIKHNNHPSDYSVLQSIEFKQSTGLSSPELKVKSAEENLLIAETYFRRRDFEKARKLLEDTLTSFDALPADGIVKMRSLLLLRDTYLIKSDSIGATDCTNLALIVFEEIIENNLSLTDYLVAKTPIAFAKPVLTKLKTIRRSRDAEVLRKQALAVSEHWSIFLKRVASSISLECWLDRK